MDVQADHIGVVVRDLEATVGILSGTLGLKTIRQETLADRKLRVAFLELGAIQLELVECLDVEERDRRLGGAAARIEHLALAVGDLDQALEDGRRRGLSVRVGPRFALGRRTAMLDDAGTGGILIQLVESRR
jgi:methylmalonyl-CoA/ethylmalonyl-CoA epimerase